MFFQNFFRFSFSIIYLLLYFTIKKKDIRLKTNVAKCYLRGGASFKSENACYSLIQTKSGKFVRYKNFLYGQRVFCEFLARTARAQLPKTPKKPIFEATKSAPPHHIFVSCSKLYRFLV